MKWFEVTWNLGFDAYGEAKIRAGSLQDALSRFQEIMPAGVRVRGIVDVQVSR